MSSLFASATGIVKTAQSSLVIRDHAVLPLFSIGEEVPITIIQRISARQYLVNVKDRMILADSEAPLQAGNELRVRIDQQHPRMVLRILSESVAPKDIFAESLRLFRANPQGLLTNLMQTEDLLAQAILNPRMSLLLHDDIRTLLQLIQTLRYSQNSVGNRDYLRDYATELGMLMESDVKKTLLTKGERGVQNNGTPCGIKGLLYRLAEKLGAMLGDDGLPDEIRLSLRQLQTAAEKTVKTIENQQILNVMLRETENTSMLQIPLLFPGGMKLAEIFIREDDHADSPSGDRHSFTVALLFDLDLLGEVLIELRVRDNKLDCLFKCDKEAVQALIFSHLPALQGKLLDLGYRVEQLTCVVEEDLEEQKAALCRNYRLYTGESINIFA
ncbi:MAG: hypothetical protein ACYC5X_10860 [Syntrophales bacterium]